MLERYAPYRISILTVLYPQEQYVIDHYAQISLHTPTFCTKIEFHAYQLLCPKLYISRSPTFPSSSEKGLRRPLYISQI